jgi:hypothetical protein
MELALGCDLGIFISFIFELQRFPADGCLELVLQGFISI